MFLGDLIKKYRTENKLSQRDFAKLANLSHTYIAALEKNIDPRTGKPIAPTLDTVKYIAKAMNIDIDVLLHMLEDGQEFDLKNEAPKYTDDYENLKDVRMASNNGVDLDGLSEEDIKQVNDFVEFIRNKKKD